MNRPHKNQLHQKNARVRGACAETVPAPTVKIIRCPDGPVAERAVALNTGSTVFYQDPPRPQKRFQFTIRSVSWPYKTNSPIDAKKTDFGAVL